MTDKNQKANNWSSTRSRARSISFGFSYSKCGSNEIDPHEYRSALQDHIAELLQRLNEIDVPGLTDGEGI